MAFIARTDRSVLGRWWWTVDRWTLACLILLATFGLLLSLAASPPVAERIGLEPLYFVRRHASYVPVALVIMIVVSLQQPRQIRRLGVILFAASLVLLSATVIFGDEIKFCGDQPALAIEQRFAHANGYRCACHGDCGYDPRPWAYFFPVVGIVCHELDDAIEPETPTKATIRPIPAHTSP